MFYETDELGSIKAELCPLDNIECNPYEDGMREKIKEFSPESHVDKWETPMLIIHGNNDYRVSLTQGLSTFTALRLKKVDAKLIYYPLENHWVVSNVTNQVVWLQEIINWFKKYAPPEEEDSSSSESSEIESSSESSKSRSRSSESSESSKSRSSSSDSSESSSKSRSSSSSSSDDSNSNKDDDGTNILTIVLIILAILFLLLLAVFCIFRYRKKIRNDDLEKDVNKADLIM
jgi:preprotein translocase subunit SecG